MDIRRILDKHDSYEAHASLPEPPDENDPLLTVAWWQTIFEIAETNRWNAAQTAKETSSWDEVGVALKMSGASARQAIRIRKENGTL